MVVSFVFLINLFFAHVEVHPTKGTCSYYAFCFIEVSIVEYALSRSMSPTLVSDYTLHLPDKKLLQNKLRELTELALESGEGDEE